MVSGLCRESYPFLNLQPLKTSPYLEPGILADMRCSVWEPWGLSLEPQGRTVFLSKKGRENIGPQGYDTKTQAMLAQARITRREGDPL